MAVPYQPDRKKFEALAATCKDGRPTMAQLRMNGMLPWS